MYMMKRESKRSEVRPKRTNSRSRFFKILRLFKSNVIVFAIQSRVSMSGVRTSYDMLPARRAQSHYDMGSPSLRVFSSTHEFREVRSMTSLTWTHCEKYGSIGNQSRPKQPTLSFLTLASPHSLPDSHPSSSSSVWPAYPEEDTPEPENDPTGRRRYDRRNGEACSGECILGTRGTTGSPRGSATWTRRRLSTEICATLQRTSVKGRRDMESSSATVVGSLEPWYACLGHRDANLGKRD